MCSREGAVDIKSLAEPSRASRKIECASNMRTPSNVHHIDPLKGFNRPNEHRTTNTFGFTHHIYAVIHSVNKVDIAVTT